MSGPADSDDGSRRPREAPGSPATALILGLMPSICPRTWTRSWSDPLAVNPVAAPAWANLSVRTPSCRLSAVALLSWTQATLLRRPTASRISGQRSRIEPASAGEAAAAGRGGAPADGSGRAALSAGAGGSGRVAVDSGAAGSGRSTGAAAAAGLTGG